EVENALGAGASDRADGDNTAVLLDDDLLGIGDGGGEVSEVDAGDGVSLEGARTHEVADENIALEELGVKGAAGVGRERAGGDPVDVEDGDGVHDRAAVRRQKDDAAVGAD